MGADHADAGTPMSAELLARPAVRFHKFETATRQLSLRNTGVNTLWLSFDRENWFDVACGTSFDDRVNIKGFWYCTQLGTTTAVVNGLALNVASKPIPSPTTEELA